MNREPLRNPARSAANLEMHQVGDLVNETARRIVAELEHRGVAAINPPMAFPMEADRWPERMWVVSHKPVAVAAGLGRMGIHRNLIHPRFGNFILLGTVLLDLEVEGESKPLDFNPCLTCKLCVAACPVGAIGPDGSFNFSACYHHNYREFMGGFGEWVERIAESRNGLDYRRRVKPSESVSLWQSLAFGPNYKAAYCMAVCPAGEDVISAFRRDKAQFIRDTVKPLQDKVEPLYVVPGSDAEARSARRFPHKIRQPVRNSLMPRTTQGLLRGMVLTFQPDASRGLNAVFHFIFTGTQALEASVEIRDCRITVSQGQHGRANVTVTADGETWLRYLRRETGILLPLLLGRIRVRGPLHLLRAFGRCFPS